MEDWNEILERHVTADVIDSESWWSRRTCGFWRTMAVVVGSNVLLTL